MLFVSPWYIRTYRFLTPKLLRFAQLQLFLTVVSLPFLIAWGLPLSIMSCVGNLIFGPFLAFFLLISCILFFLEVCSLPNRWIILVLEYLTRFWSWLISQGSATWLISFAKPPLWMLACLLLSGFFIMHHKKLSRPFLSTICFFVLIVTAIVFLKYYSDAKMVIKKIPCNAGFVTLIKASGVVTIIDPGVIGQRIAGSWIEYTLIKELVQNFGTTTIDHLIITKPGILTFDYIADLCRLAHVAKIYLPLWQGENDKRLLQKYGRMRYELGQKKGTLMRFGLQTPQTIIVSKNIKIVIESLEKQLQYKKITFPSVCIQLISGDQNNKINLS